MKSFAAASRAVNAPNPSNRSSVARTELWSYGVGSTPNFTIGDTITAGTRTPYWLKTKPLSPGLSCVSGSTVPPGATES